MGLMNHFAALGYERLLENISAKGGVTPSKQLHSEVSAYRSLLLRTRTEFENMLKIKNRIAPDMTITDTSIAYKVPKFFHPNSLTITM